ncbi:MAG: hypothetical protein C4527_08905 [Candidatus Omnitrophota bacterium]|jgi:hypothetical protein|nr:MAG: hypothetical protein C4527_08905 [Candidatus Omnitrophota bacterium]
MKKTIRIPFIFIFLPFLFGSIYGNSEEKLIGDESDGSRAISVHRIPLLDDEGMEIDPDDDPVLPFSMRRTCSADCHRYETISAGWHFNAATSAIDHGRAGHPWIYVNASSGAQIPLSYRSWPGTYRPEQIGLSPWQFVLQFGRHMPGGGVGEFDESQNPDAIMRIFVSGKLDVNCLSCHDADPAHDQAEYALQIARQNFRWAAAATAGFAAVSGAAAKMPDTYDYQMPEPPDDPKIISPSIVYRETEFDEKNRVFFHLVRQVPNERCYFCHSSKPANPSREKWMMDEDVHLAAGLHCVDCHRNGLDHTIVRGYEGESAVSTNPLAISSSCEGCHLGDAESIMPLTGRFSAPVPKHAGIPLVHFEKMTCTVCHSGPWPEAKTQLVKTSLAHGLGIRNVDKSETALPHIVTPVFARQANGKIAPHHLLWPAFWGRRNGEQIEPLVIEFVKTILTKFENCETIQTTRDWPEFSLELIKEVLIAMQAQMENDGKPVYIGGGKLYALDENDTLIANEHETAEPYGWPIAHDVRPAAQSLGVRGCEDCHAVDAPFFFGDVIVDSPLVCERENVRTMIEFEELDAAYMKTLAATFVFRPWFKAAMIVLSIVLVAILLWYGFQALHCVMNFLSEKEDKL